MTTLNEGGFLRYSGDYKNLIFYKKSLVLYDLTFYFKEHYLLRGDRTQDQMEQAARSGKQNIVEGLTDGMTSKEMAIKLLNVARGSLKELQEDYEDYLRVHGLALWKKGHPRYDKMVQYCYRHHEADRYVPFVERWTAEEFCNTAVTLCHQTDRGLMKYMQQLESAFLTEGGIKEQMSSARRKARGY